MDAIQTVDGVTLPLVGLGTYKNVTDYNQLLTALQLGYRLIDTASFYHNEEMIGRAVKESNIPRCDLHIATKIWPGDFGTDATKRSVDRSLKRLDTDYIDILYLHWYGKNYLQSWRVLESMKEQGVVRTIGVCNFSVNLLEELSCYANIQPSINQIELHPHCPQNNLLHYLHKKNILPQAYSPIARGLHGILKDPSILSAAAHHKKTPAQIILRWHIQRNTIVIPKSINDEHLRSNLELFDFSLNAEECAAIDLLETIPWRIGHDSEDAAWLEEIAHVQPQ